jgi:hypothetical protein
MPSKTFALGGVAALAVFVAAAAFVPGVGPASGGPSAEGDSFPTETPAGPDDGGEDDGTGAASGTAAPFGFHVDGVEECGTTCRDVTSTVTNRQGAPAEDVTVHTRVFVGNGTDGDAAWRGTERVGTLDAGASHTATRRVELSYADGLAVQASDGWITVQTTVQTADRTVTYTERRQVA